MKRVLIGLAASSLVLGAVSVAAPAASAAPTASVTTANSVSPQAVATLTALYNRGLRGEPLRVMWAIAMRESGGNSTLRSPSTGTYPNGTFDSGLFQTNSAHAANLAAYGYTVDDMLDSNKAFDYWMRMTSPKNKLMSSLRPFGLRSWSSPRLDARDYPGWTKEQHNSWIVAPFRNYYNQFPEVMKSAGLVDAPSRTSVVNLPATATMPAITLTTTGRAVRPI